MRLQRGQGRVVDLSETQLYAQDLKSLRMQSQHHGRRFGTLTAQQEREISELCTHCRNIMRTEEGQYLDLRTEQWETLPEPYREAASKIMDYIIQRFKQLPMSERSGQAAEAPFLEDQTADKSVFTEPHLLSDAFNRLKRSDTPNEPSLLPAGVCRCPVAKDNYCFYQALTTAMGLGMTGEALFQQIVLLAQNTLTEFPQTLSLLNSILANSMSTVEELAALAFVEYAGVQMWGHTGMLSLIAWWFGSPVLVTTPATWEGNGALLFLADGTWEFVQTEAGGGLHTVEILQTMFPFLAVIENADNHWSVLRVENVARHRRR